MLAGMMGIAQKAVNSPGYKKHAAGKGLAAGAGFDPMNGMTDRHQFAVQSRPVAQSAFTGSGGSTVSTSTGNPYLNYQMDPLTGGPPQVVDSGMQYSLTDQNSTGPNSQYTVDANDTKADRMQATLTRRQWELMQDRYHPMEDELLGMAMDDGLAGRTADQAGARVNTAFDGTQAMTQRNLRRRGINADGDQRRAMGLRDAIARETGVAQTENSTRRQVRDGQTELATNLMNVGQGVASESTQNVNAAGDLATQRKAANAQRSAANKQSMISAGLGMAGLALAFM